MIVFIFCLSCHFLYRDFSCFRKNGLRRASHDSFGTRTISLTFCTASILTTKCPDAFQPFTKLFFLVQKEKHTKKKLDLKRPSLRALLYILLLYSYMNMHKLFCVYFVFPFLPLFFFSSLLSMSSFSCNSSGEMARFFIERKDLL